MNTNMRTLMTTITIMSTNILMETPRTPMNTDINMLTNTTMNINTNISIPAHRIHMTMNIQMSTACITIATQGMRQRTTHMIIKW
jgi:hypothetical protein